jgi:hypothetical protein
LFAESFHGTSSAVQRADAHPRQITYRGYARADGLWNIDCALKDTKPFPFPHHAKALSLPVAEGEHVEKGQILMQLAAPETEQKQVLARQLY